MKKSYADASNYEKKLAKAMERFGVKDFEYNFNWDRFGCWIQFHYKGELYRFEHSVENAKKHGIDISYGSDSFAQLVLALEDLARIAERGIYDIQRWIVGMRCLPAPDLIPECFSILGFKEIPTDEEAIKKKYRNFVKLYHPDAGGNKDDFQKITTAYESCLKHIKIAN